MASVTSAGATTINVPATVSASNWTAGTTPTVSQGSFYGDSCVSAAFCVAVGQSGGGPSPLIEQWNGAAWTVMTGATVTGSSGLQAVSCTSTTFCVAVGNARGGTLVEQWNGTVWTLVASPNVTGVVSDYLTGVSCTSSTVCKAVGQAYFGSSVYTPVALSLTGATWTVDTTPNPSGGGYFNAVSCTVSASSTSCMAVGTAGGDSTLTEQWNGSAWTILSDPNPTGLTSVSFSGVSCVGPSWCMGAGSGYNGTVYQTVLGMWSGSAWSVLPSPNQGSDSNSLQGISCFSATSCSAVGPSSPSGTPAPESLTWNGVAWALATTPSQAGANATYVISAPIARSGYRFVASDGGTCSPTGAGAPFLGIHGRDTAQRPIVGMAVMPAGDGYYLVASDGGIFNYGSAKFYGSTGSTHLNAPSSAWR
jgi:hypothetical protein